MRVFYRYLLWQALGWLIAGIILWLLHRWLGLPLWVAVLLIGADIGKDLLLYPALKRAYEGGEASGTERLAGAQGEVRQALEPEGWVKVRGEFWKARTAGDGELPIGSRVKVTGHRGRTLVVEPDLSWDRGA